MNGLQRLCRRAVCAPIRAYRRWVSPGLGANKCRYVPCCSEYALQAVETHGCIKGLLLAAWRLARCNPLGRWGIDPVPEQGEWVSRKRVLYKAGSGKKMRRELSTQQQRNGGNNAPQ